MVDAERDFTSDHIKRFVPAMAVRGWAAAFRAGLTEDLVPFRLRTRCEDSDLLANNLEQVGRLIGRDRERLWHGFAPFLVKVPATRAEVAVTG